MSLAQYVEQSTRRPSSLSSAVVFDVSIGASATTFYTGKPGEFFLIRRIALVNRTGGSINGAISVGANVWFSAAVGSNTIDVVDELAGFLINPSIDLSATGQNLRVVGWGVRVTGGEDWTL
jgi:hypothetical protein